MRALSLPVLFAALASTAAAQQPIYVDDGAPAGGNGSSWATAYNDLRQALGAASAGATLWVADGLYLGGFSVPSGVTVLGGFEPGATRDSQRNPVKRPTVLEGGGNNRVVNLGAQCVLDGVIVQGGYWSGGAGAAINSRGVVVRNCVFRANAIYSGSGTAMLIGPQADPVIENSVFVNNDWGGNAIDVNPGGTGTFSNLVIWGNKVDGMYLGGNTTAVIRNCVFGMNGGVGLHDATASNQPVLENNLFWNNVTAQFRYRGQALNTATAINGVSYAKNNLVVDPLFVNPIAEDFHIMPFSPMVDAGQNTGGSNRDFFAAPRVLDGNLDGSMIADIGVHEYGDVTLSITGNATPGGTIQIDIAGTLPGFLLFGFRTGPGVVVPPFGTTFLDLTRPIVGIFVGVLPSQSTVTIPPSFPVGAGVPFQALGFTNNRGNLSNVIDLLIQ